MSLFYQTGSDSGQTFESSNDCNNGHGDTDCDNEDEKILEYCEFHLHILFDGLDELNQSFELFSCKLSIVNKT